VRDSGGGSGESPNGKWCLGLDVEASGSGRPAVPLATRELLKSNKLKGRLNSSDLDGDCVGDKAESSASD